MYVYVCMYKKMNITISIPQEIEVKLKDVENKSGLITRLLTEHFEKDENPEILKLKREKLVNDMDSKLKQMDYEIEVREKSIKQVQTSESEIIQKRKDKIISVQATARDIFDKHITPEEAEEYIDGDYETMKDYLDIDDKEVVNETNPQE